MPLNPASSAPKPPFIILIGLCVQTESCQDKTGSYLGPTPLFWPPSLDGGPGGRRDEERRACVCCTSQSLVVFFPPHLNEPARLCYHNPFSLSSSWTRTNIHTHTLMTAVFGQVNVCCIAPSPLALSPFPRQTHPLPPSFLLLHPVPLPTFCPAPVDTFLQRRRVQPHSELSPGPLSWPIWIGKEWLFTLLCPLENPGP